VSLIIAYNISYGLSIKSLILSPLVNTVGGRYYEGGGGGDQRRRRGGLG